MRFCISLALKFPPAHDSGVRLRGWSCRSFHCGSHGAVGASHQTGWTGLVHLNWAALSPKFWPANSC
jgi:hypothetical protein